ncbi:CGNR zinc finger domain-containing protein [Streptomyces sp. KK5PA1]|uniref:CGNR zinc finger domain-containing protein n=1 Tax=Actinacidiphila acididurans TaxID=2784346 RepID=A0ABS2TNM9_9ACTN|nr:CGNR zinc finger domain-containing protein [Actinacidiphila acididurans]
MQDLVNTVDLEAGAEELRTPAELTRWVRGRGLVGRGLDEDALRDVLALREALREVCLAHTGTEVPPATRERLAGLLERGPLLLEVDAEGAARIRPQPGLTGAAELVAHTAAAVARATVDGTWPRLKACASDTCRWVYYDRSPAGRSRWCTMAICGSRAKMRTYRKNKGAATG